MTDQEIAALRKWASAPGPFEGRQYNHAIILRLLHWVEAYKAQRTAAEEIAREAIENHKAVAEVVDDLVLRLEQAERALAIREASHAPKSPHRSWKLSRR